MGNGHILLTPAECDCDHADDGRCPVCDWGLGVCKRCKGAEAELETDCAGSAEERLRREEVRASEATQGAK